jgi:GPH family glycoside/pentoside/hexuronide:cation symporter|tara:strand:+ start:250 stop:1647 length:1398 start_codon:yes stop_codon:yes gene_type:complete
MNSGKRSSLKNIQLFFYSSINFPLAVVGLPLVLFIPPLYAELGVSLSSMGVILMLARLSDVFTDPLIGLLSDRTKIRLGRRKPWIFLGAPLLAISTYFLFIPPEKPDLMYFLISVIGIYLAFTIIQIPYASWGAELSGDYNERSKITALREQFGYSGTIVAVSIPIVLSYFNIIEMRSILSYEAFLVISSIPLVILGAFWLVPDDPANLLREKAMTLKEYARSLKLILRNGPYIRILIGFTGSVLGISMDGALSFFFVKHVINAESYYSIAILLSIVTSVLFIQVWKKIANKIGKHKALVIAILWFSGWAFCMPLLYFIPDHALFFFLVLQVLKGMASGALVFLATSMAADVIDIDTIRSGEERSGLFFSAWGIVQKGAAAIALFIALTAVDLFGFDATADPSLRGAVDGNSNNAIIGLAIMYSIVPSLFKISTLPFIWNYPLTEERQKKIRGFLDRKIKRLENT